MTAPSTHILTGNEQHQATQDHEMSPLDLQNDDYLVPYKYSGTKAPNGTPNSTIYFEGKDGRTIETTTQDDGHEYIIYNERYVPYRCWESGENLTIKQAAQRYRDAYFNSVESSTRYNLSLENIEAKLKQYDAMPEEDSHRRPLGAIIAGACVERLCDIAKRIDEKRYKEPKQEEAPAFTFTFNPMEFATNGFQTSVQIYNDALRAYSETLAYTNKSIKDTFTAPPQESLPTLNELNQEASTIAEILLISGFELKTRSGSKDKDGNLNEMASEVAISISRSNPEVIVIQNTTRMDKITKAMNALDQMAVSMTELCDKLPLGHDNIKEKTTKLITAHIAHAQARLGVDPDDQELFIRATTHYKALADELKSLYDHSPDLRYTSTKTPKHDSQAQAVDLISKGIAIIDDLSRIRNNMPERVAEFIKRAERATHTDMKYNHITTYGTIQQPTNVTYTQK